MCIPSHMCVTVSFSRCCYFACSLVREMVGVFVFFTILFLEVECFPCSRTCVEVCGRDLHTQSEVWCSAWVSCDPLMTEVGQLQRHAPQLVSSFARPWFPEEDNGGLLPTAHYWLFNTFLQPFPTTLLLSKHFLAEMRRTVHKTHQG